MFRVINTVHRIRPRSKIRSPVVRLGGSRLAPKRSKVFAKEFVYHHMDEFVSCMSAGEIRVINVSTRQTVSSDDLLTLVLSAGSEKKVAPAAKPATKPVAKPKALKKEPVKEPVKEPESPPKSTKKSSSKKSSEKKPSAKKTTKKATTKKTTKKATKKTKSE